MLTNVWFWVTNAVTGMRIADFDRFQIVISAGENTDGSNKQFCIRRYRSWIDIETEFKVGKTVLINVQFAQDLGELKTKKSLVIQMPF